jgi:Rrf2 family protein
MHAAPDAYAVRALSRLALMKSPEFTTVAALAARDGIPAAFLAKIFRQLAAAGLLRSATGPNGGYALARPAETITLLDVCRAAGAALGTDECAVGLATCSDATPCPLHDTWKPLRERIQRYLLTVTLKDMAAALAGKEAQPRRRRPRERQEER